MACVLCVTFDLCFGTDQRSRHLFDIVLFKFLSVFSANLIFNLIFKDYLSYLARPQALAPEGHFTTSVHLDELVTYL